MAKIIELGKEGRERLVKGIDTLADSVVCTLGPNGRNVVISKPGEVVKSTKDGVTVAKNINLKDPVEETGVQLVNQAAINTADKAGDGTTTSTLLAREMIKLGLDSLDKGENAVEIKRGIDRAVSKVVKSLQTELSEDNSVQEEDEGHQDNIDVEAEMTVGENSDVADVKEEEMPPPIQESVEEIPSSSILDLISRDKDNIEENESSPDLFTDNNIHEFNSERNEELTDSDDDHVETDQDLLEIPSFLRRQSK